MVTIKDVAKAANVNQSTVSRALAGNPKVNENTRKRIQELAQKMGYKQSLLAKSLKERSTHVIGLLISNIVNPSIPEVVRGVEDAAREFGYLVILCNIDNSQEKEKEYLDTLRSMWVDGIVLATATEDSENLEELKDSNIPVVLVVRQYGELFDTVRVNNLQSAYRAVNYLIEKGAQRIAIANGPLDVSIYKERYRGYCNALEEHEMPIDPQLVWDFTDVTGNQCKEVAKEKIAAGVHFDAILASSGPTGPSGPYLLKGLKEKKIKVPDEVQILGFDDLPENEITDPSISIISQPFYSMGYMAVERLVNKIEGKDKLANTQFDTVLNTEMILRESTSV